MCEGDTLLIILDGYVGVGNCRGREEDQRPSWELNGEFQVPKNEMAASLRVESAQGLDGTPAECKIQYIAMLERPNIATEVESRAEKNRVWERASEFWVAQLQRRVGAAIELMKTRGPQGKGGCSKLSTEK